MSTVARLRPLPAPLAGVAACVAGGVVVAALAERLGTTPERVWTWMKRLATKGHAGLDDESRRGRKPPKPLEKSEHILTEATKLPTPR